MKINTPLVSAVVVSVWLSACGGGGGSGGGGGGGSSGDDVRDTLVALGVDVNGIESESRVDDDGDALPADYNPLGSANSFGTIEEVLLIGPQFPNSTSLMNLYELQGQGANPVRTWSRTNLFAPAPAQTPWASSVGANPANLRTAVAADIDGDGLDEVAVLFREGAQGPITLQTYQESVNGGVISFAVGQPIVVSTGQASDLSLLAGDFNGDGLAEFVVGITNDAATDAAQLLFVGNDSGVLALSQLTKTLPRVVASSKVQLSMASGNLDYDAGSEFVVVVNELFQSANNDAGVARYYLFDDAKTDHAEVAVSDHQIRALLNQVNRTAIVADVAVGDIDGDNIDEIVFAGLQNFDAAGTCSYRYLMVALDDIKRSNVPLGGLDLPQNIHSGCSASPGQLRYVHVNVLDLDGDGLAEVQANQYVFHDFVNNAPWTQYVWGLDVNDQPLHALIDDASLFANAGGFTGRFAADNSTMTVGDATADGRQNIVFYSQATNRLETWGLINPDKAWQKMHDVATPATDPDNPTAPSTSTMQAPGSEPIRPLILASNVNHDSLAVRFSEGTYRLVFTQPVVIAVLAAAPCYADPSLGQNLDSCRTSFGTSTSTGNAQERIYTVRAGVTVGVDADVNVFGARVQASVIGKLEGHASRSTSSAYTVTKAVERTTGPIEDTVIFTTVPLDQYIYEITSSSDPSEIGTKVTISLPREPVTIQVERDRYNANVRSGPIVDSQVLAHTRGNPRSYPTVTQRNSLLAQFPGAVGTQSNDKVTDTVTVGNSSGSTTVSVEVAVDSTQGFAYGADFDLEMQATAGIVVAGFSVGGGFEDSLQITHGTATQYTGTVADMDVPTSVYGQNFYSWGLFTYVYDDSVSGQQYEIVNYWVE